MEKPARAVTLTCKLCGRTLGSSRGLAQHLYRVHRSSDQPYRCDHDQCSYRTKYKKSLAIHVKGVHLGVRFPCDLCTATFTTKANIKRHKMKVHGIGVNVNAKDSVSKRSSKTFKCSHCSKTFVDSYVLGIHVRIHTKEKPFGCPAPGCEWRTHRKDQIAIHVRTKHVKSEGGGTRTSNSPTWSAALSTNAVAQCPFCKRTYKKSALENHIRTHTQEKPYACHLCEHTCTEAGNLRRHISLCHTELPRVPCPSCDKTFRVATEMNQHVRNCHAFKNVKGRFTKCTVCRKKILRIDRVIRHYRTQHGIDLDVRVVLNELPAIGANNTYIDIDRSIKIEPIDFTSLKVESSSPPVSPSPVPVSPGVGQLTTENWTDGVDWQEQESDNKQWEWNWQEQQQEIPIDVKEETWHF